MDSKLKRQVTIIATLGVLIIITIALFANGTTIKKKLNSNENSTSDIAVVSTEQSPQTADSNGFIKLGNNLEGWKGDETFFDSEADSLAMKLMEKMSTIEIRAFSVEKDLRVRILDYNGNLIKDIPFEISVKSSDGSVEKTVIDEDMDGVIYITELTGGKYDLSVASLNDWIVPETPIRVTVKNKVSYTMIEDIDLDMKSEASLASMADNAMLQSAADNADKKLTQQYGKDETLVYGIDVSSENGEIDWNQVYQSGIRFVMLRAGYRGAFSGDIITDDSFAENAKNAYRAGIDVGAYFYTQAVNEREAVEEASALLLLCSQTQISYPLCIRVDTAGGLGRADELDTGARTTIVNAFCETVESAGYDACFYATKNWLNTNLNTDKLGKNIIWLAEYRAVPTYEGYYDMWQYSNKGKVSGIDGEVNLNISYMNR